MGREPEDRAERILSIYSRLQQGKVLNKDKESIDFCVSPRTIQRDVADLQCFLQNQNVENGQVQEIIFDKSLGGYILQKKNQDQLNEREILAITKILLESRALTKGELFPIIDKILRLCSNDAQGKLISELLSNEMHHYVELRHGKQLLDRLWELEQAIKKQKYIEIQYKKLKNQDVVTRKLKPVGIMFSEFYFYLTAFIEDINKEEAFQNPDDIFPTIYRVDRLQQMRVLEEHFIVPYAERFEEGEFRKRVQFMYGGRLRRVRMRCTEQCKEAVLDRLPTAEVEKEADGGYIVRAEVFGAGIDMWLKSQGDGLEIVEG